MRNVTRNERCNRKQSWCDDNHHRTKDFINVGWLCWCIPVVISNKLWRKNSEYNHEHMLHIYHTYITRKHGKILVIFKNARIEKIRCFAVIYSLLESKSYVKINIIENETEKLLKPKKKQNNKRKQLKKYFIFSTFESQMISKQTGEETAKRRTLYRDHILYVVFCRGDTGRSDSDLSFLFWHILLFTWILYTFVNKWE